jgi:hypothetical protein
MAEVLRSVGGTLALFGGAGVLSSFTVPLTMRVTNPGIAGLLRKARKPSVVMLAVGVCLLLLSLA